MTIEEYARVSYVFDGFEIDPAAFRISQNGRALRIEPKALQVLIYLLERAGRLITKQELLEAAWPGIAVTENALTRAIAQLRKTLGDDASTPRYIETVPTRGYRFIGLTQPEVAQSPAPRGRLRRVLIAVAAALLALVIVGRFIVRDLDRKSALQAVAPPPIPGTLLHPSPRFQVSPSFSPDGASMVYSVDVDGVPHLFTCAVGGGDERQLTAGEDGQAQPAWSPDGKQIAFTSIRNHGIWLVDVAQGTERRLTSFGSRPSWSFDGAEIAFQSAEDVEYGWNAYDALPPSAIWIVDVASGKATALTRAGTPAGGHGAPSWRRDGKRLVFSSCDHERCRLFTVARDSTGLTQILTDSRRLSSPLFANDGRTIYAVLSRYNESMILALSLDAYGKPLGGFNPVRQSNPGVIQYVTLSRDGSRFAWSVIEEKSDLFTVDTTSGISTKLPGNPATNPTFPSFSPDGTKIAYCAVASGDDSGIWIANADGTNSRALVTGPGLKQYVHWGKSEWEVFYGAWSAERHRALLYRASLIKGQPALVAVLPEGAAAPALSPDGRTVAFNRTIDGKTGVWTSSLDGSSLRRLADEADLARFPFWSPDGRHVGVQLRRGSSAIGIFPERKVVATGGESWPHAWSPAGDAIAFAGRRDGVWNVWTVDARSGVEKRVTGYASMLEWVRTPSWSPDGKRIIFERGRPSGNVWISEPRVAE